MPSSQCAQVDHRFESEIVEDPDQLNTALDPDVKADYLGCLFHVRCSSRLAELSAVSFI